MDQDSNICELKGIGEKRAQLFYKLGVVTIGDLIRFYPRAYEDWSKAFRIEDAPFNKICCVRAAVAASPEVVQIRKGLTLFRVIVTDGTALMVVTMFNAKYTVMKLKEGHEYYFYGKIINASGGISKEMRTPEIASLEEALRIKPTYPQTKRLTSRSVEKTVVQAFDQLEDIFTDNLPQSLREHYRLCHMRYALENIHFPSSMDAMLTARHRLIFEELFVLQLGLMRLKHKQHINTAVRIQRDFTQEFYRILPFAPTHAQRVAVEEAVKDMKNNVPMNRLLQGDVGSGKTAVAAALVYNTAKNGAQSAVMAPTEILAEQHYRTFSTLLRGTGIRCELLKGSLKPAEKRAVKQRLAAGKTDLVIGTHALISRDVAFHNLGLVVTDEQHRFGVAQRMALAEKGYYPHIYVMSATPIPRTLALIIYGDLDISILDELPPGRQKVHTYAVSSKLRERIHHFVQSAVHLGRQAYIVCPLVEENADSPLLSAKKYAKEVQADVFKDYKVGLLYGKMKADDKDKVMRKFAAGEIQILVTTTVIEVGVDVPNATVMVIENAENFGLSQLHQLRGRVGRGTHKSTCVLVSDAKNDEAIRRLNAMCETTDGFRIADEDLKLRGPGDFFGARQHGLPELKIADMLTDISTLKQAQEAAEKWLGYDPELRRVSSRGLRTEVDRLFDTIDETGLN